MLARSRETIILSSHQSIIVVGGSHVSRKDTIVISGNGSIQKGSLGRRLDQLRNED